MSASGDSYAEPLRRAAQYAQAHLDGMPSRRVPAEASVEDMLAAFGTTLPEGPTDPAEVIDLLGGSARPGIVDSPSGRFFGFVMGGVMPAPLAADWLVSTWDQNAGLKILSPAHAALEQIAAQWLLDVLGLPDGSAVGFCTGATTANFTGLAAGRHAVLAATGWDVGEQGLNGAPPVRVLVGQERHDTVDLALRYLGLGRPETVPADEQGRMRADVLAERLAEGGDRPTIVCLQAGNIHSGDCDPLEPIIARAHKVGAWVHVDGAFGLWAAASPRHRHLVAGLSQADSWATDAHKTLNVGYDSGVCVVRDPTAMKAAMGMHGDYLITDPTVLESYERVPELSRRARAVPVWAALRSLGRTGLAELVDRLCRHARSLAEGAAAIPGVRVLNEVVFTQVSLVIGSDARTEEVARRLLEEGTVWMTGSHWHGRSVLRISVSNWSTDEKDVAVALAALERVVTATAEPAVEVTGVAGA